MRILPLLRSGLAAALLLATASARAEIITFLHINDVYEITPRAGKGGFAPLMTLLEDERSRNKLNITTFGGDLISPSILSGMLKGQQMIDLMNRIGVQIAVAGNHEYDFGADVAVDRFRESKFPWLAANVKQGTQTAPGLAPTWMTEIGGYKFGFFGILTPTTLTSSIGARDLIFEDPIQTAQKAVADLKSAGAEVIVALTHLDYAVDLTLAEQVKGIALILGGHDHIPIAIFENGVLLFKAGTDAYFLGAVDLDVNRVKGRDGKETVQATPVSWRMRTTAGVAPQAAIQERVKYYEGEMDKALAQIVGVTRTPLDSRVEVVRGGEAAIGDLIADAMMAAEHGDLAITNGGGIRGNRQYPAGTELTRKDILAELPFGNRVAVVTMIGAQVQAALENGVSLVENKAGRYPQVAGVAFKYDPAAPAGRRTFDIMVGGQPLDPVKSYRVITSDFLYNGGDGYIQFKQGKLLNDIDDSTTLALVVMDYVLDKKAVDPKVDGRSTVAKRP